MGKRARRRGRQPSPQTDRATQRLLNAPHDNLNCQIKSLPSSYGLHHAQPWGYYPYTSDPISRLHMLVKSEFVCSLTIDLFSRKRTCTQTICKGIILHAHSGLPLANTKKDLWARRWCSAYCGRSGPGGVVGRHSQGRQP